MGSSVPGWGVGGLWRAPGAADGSMGDVGSYLGHNTLLTRSLTSLLCLLTLRAPAIHKYRGVVCFTAFTVL